MLIINVEMEVTTAATSKSIQKCHNQSKFEVWMNHKFDGVNKSLDLQKFSRVVFKCSQVFIMLSSAITLNFFL